MNTEPSKSEGGNHGPGRPNGNPGPNGRRRRGYAKKRTHYFSQASSRAKIKDKGEGSAQATPEKIFAGGGGGGGGGTKGGKGASKGRDDGAGWGCRGPPLLFPGNSCRGGKKVKTEGEKKNNPSRPPKACTGRGGSRVIVSTLYRQGYGLLKGETVSGSLFSTAKENVEISRAGGGRTVANTEKTRPPPLRGSHQYEKRLGIPPRIQGRGFLFFVLCWLKETGRKKNVTSETSWPSWVLWDNRAKTKKAREPPMATRQIFVQVWKGDGRRSMVRGTGKEGTVALGAGVAVGITARMTVRGAGRTQMDSEYCPWL